jgi:methyl coenzyme M reductase beta subunit
MRTAHSTSELMARWRKATADADARAPIYRDTEMYEVGDALIHPRHGLGVVQQVIHENAALVLFREVEVPLEMGRGLGD